MRNKNKLLYSLTGLALLCLLIFSFRPFGRTHPRFAARAGAGTVTHPVPVPIPRPTVTLPLPPFSFPPGRGKIAVVLDDWGYTLSRSQPSPPSIAR